MLSSSTLPHKFWAEALSTAVYLKNCSYTKAVFDMTPMKLGVVVSPMSNILEYMGVCHTHAHIPKEEQLKLDSKAKQCILLGYGSTTKGYRLYDIKRERVCYSRDVVFDEMKLEIQKEQNKPETENNYFGIDLSSKQTDDLKML